jgi:hypothetical protein
MKWKTLGKVAKLVAYAVVPGAAGYVAYKHLVRPWLDKRATKKRETLPPSPAERIEDRAPERENSGE